MQASEEVATERKKEETVATGGQPTADLHRAAIEAGSPGRGATVEHGLYALLFVAALALRLSSLGDLNAISPREAAQIWPVWLDHSAGTLAGSSIPTPPPAASPLLYTLQRALFLLTGGGGNFWARFAPACAGAALALAAWPLRARMGRGGALMAAVLFAFDPWLLSFSRLADGAALSALTGVLLLAGLFNSSGGYPRIRTLAAVGGLFLISGPLSWLLLPPLLYALFLRGGGLLAMLGPRERSQAALIGLGTVALGGTAFFANVSGLAGIGSSLGVAVAHVLGGSGMGGVATADLAYSANWSLLRLLVDEPFVLFFGGAGAVIALYRTRFFTRSTGGGVGRSGDGAATESQSEVDRQWLRVLVAGAAWGIALALLPGVTPLSLLALGLPLLLLAAETATSLLRLAPPNLLVQNDARLPAFVTMGALLVTAFFWTGNVTDALQDGSFDSRLTVFYLLIPALGAFFVWWSGLRASSQVFGHLAFIALFLAQASSSWMLNLRPESDHSRTLFAEKGDRGMALLAEDIQRLSSLRTGDPTEARVYLQAESAELPYYGWTLRAMRNLRLQTGINPAEVEEGALIVVPVGAWGAGERAQLPGGYIGSSYTTIERWLPTELDRLGNLMRWMLFRERRNYSGSAPARQEVELWVLRER